MSSLDGPIQAAEFDRLMAVFAPFEAKPTIAVAVSGGADSLALALLLKDWLAPRGGTLWAVTVDHGLRPAATAEARWVVEGMARHGIAHACLTWPGQKPATGLQAAARRARYEMLEAFCKDRGILHLCIGHHREDQSETLLMRVRQGSDGDGLAAMSAQRILPACRLLRPLLPLPKARLQASLAARGESWISDPSNDNPAFERVQLRQVAPILADLGLGTENLWDFARSMGRARQALEEAICAFLARHGAIRPAGYATLDRQALLSAPPVLASGVLRRLLAAVGGRSYPVSPTAVARLLARWQEATGSGGTLGGCGITEYGDKVLIYRENRSIPSIEVVAGQRLHWDGRFSIQVSHDVPTTGLYVAGLGTVAAGRLRRELARSAGAPGKEKGNQALTSLVDQIPVKIWPSLPAFWAKEADKGNLGLLSVPALGYIREDCPRGLLTACRYLPESGLLPATFTLV